MNKLIALLLVTIPLIGNAKTIAYTLNKNEGKIVLTDENCQEIMKGNTGLLAYTSAKAETSGSINFGCWVIDEFAEQLIIRWQGSKAPNIYDLNGWIINKEK